MPLVFALQPPSPATQVCDARRTRKESRSRERKDDSDHPWLDGIAPGGTTMANTHYFPPEKVHYTWDVRHEPAMEIDSGDVVVVRTRDVSDNQITPTSTTPVLAALNWERVYPLAGPIHVKGAQPGDTLAVEITDIRTEGWGWTAILPGFGLLADDFSEPYLRIFDLTNGDAAYLRDDIAIPIEPFFGTMGVCPAGANKQAVMPPGTFGGNMDTRQLTRGSHALPPSAGRRRPVQLRRCPRRAG